MSNRPTNGGRKKSLRKRLLERDGTSCFYCHTEMDCHKYSYQAHRPLGLSIEHLLDVKDGGKLSMFNCVLAHEKCNQKAAKLGLTYEQKLELAYANRLNKHS